MNKIFKVVWSKVKHCYVVVSEVAKNVINSSVKSAKISGTPMTRGLALGAMMAFVITGNAWAINLPVGSETDKVSNVELVGAGLQKINNNRFVGEQGKKVYDVRIITTGNFYRDGNMQLWTGFTLEAEGTIIDCSFEINDNDKMNFSGYLELTGAHVANNFDQYAYNNSVIISNAEVKTRCTTKDVTTALGLYGALGNGSAVNSILYKNNLEITNSTLYYNSDKSLYIWGSQQCWKFC